ncbi:hypothetical protein MUK42_05462 [Musa troglodytarum]|uniref:Uncharacterized protein n=2 Tax=Musa troglodytarum TaxID=320322 RepID=A0A9E7EL09_9LILI|nr:hypothetical protein MUK42_05462 [Musa troglodytarum]
MNWLSRKVFMYKVTFGLYVLEWWEQCLFSILFHHLLSLSVLYQLAERFLEAKKDKICHGAFHLQTIVPHHYALDGCPHLTLSCGIIVCLLQLFELNILCWWKICNHRDVDLLKMVVLEQKQKVVVLANHVMMCPQDFGLQLLCKSIPNKDLDCASGYISIKEIYRFGDC